MFHDVRTSYAIAFSILESIVFEQEGKDFHAKLQRCSRKIIDLYESLDLVNSQLELIDVMVNSSAITQGSKRESNLYQLTHKLTKLFEVRAKKRELKFRLIPNSDIPNKYYHESIKLIAKK
ncbi:hypothetical protein EGT74_23460 [Chitinophaga lutea]|uniref:Uncharacterized protein n=1 Tax=Chitinophaga lutea TaxID=2488634 RepID=A0A3N4PNQ2_9BACT|nr:hypothetical protein [Chitinophaga lutea]RPE05350.1 hypothetical protein EGT74_23460 [Chitinophaga lutea]